MSLKDVISDARPLKVSFEFSPPRTDEAEETLWKAIRRLEPLNPSFVSVTYGAGGSTRERTHHTVKRIVDETSLKPAAHLTCVGAPSAEIDEIVQGYWDAGIRHIVALRGDMPDMQGAYTPHPDGYAYTPDLIEGILKIAPFDISVSCYPERHPDSQSMEHDIELLKRKVDAGASRALTQFGFDNDLIARYRDRVAAQGIAIPIVPGIIPTTGIKAITRMAEKSGATVPPWLARLYEGLDGDVETRRIVAAAVLAEQVQELRARGFEQFHFYVIGQPDLTYAACRILGMQPAAKASS